MKPIVGCAFVRKVAALEGDTQRVLVTDVDGFVRLALGACSFPADLTVEEARHIAQALMGSADRVERGDK